MITKYCKFALALLFTSFILIGCSVEDNSTSNTQKPLLEDKNLAGLFPDINLQSCIDELATTNKWQSSAQLSGALDCSNKNIQSLAGMEYLIYLTNVNFSNNKIENVAPLAELPRLEVVRLQNNAIGIKGDGNVDKLTSLTQASDINIAGNKSISCTELTTLTSAFNRSGNSSTMQEIVNPEPYDKVNCTL